MNFKFHVVSKNDSDVIRRPRREILLLYVHRKIGYSYESFHPTYRSDDNGIHCLIAIPAFSMCLSEN